MSETAPKKARTRKVPQAIPPQAEAPSSEQAGPTLTFAERFRSAGTVAAHECPNGHGATAPVAPDHTWCSQCLRHWTVAPASPA